MAIRALPPTTPTALAGPTESARRPSGQAICQFMEHCRGVTRVRAFTAQRSPASDALRAPTPPLIARNEMVTTALS